MADGLTFFINLETQAASIDLFFKGMDDIRGLLRDVDYAMHKDKSSRRRVISNLHSSSPTLTVNPLLGDKETVEVAKSEWCCFLHQVLYFRMSYIPDEEVLLVLLILRLLWIGHKLPLLWRASILAPSLRTSRLRQRWTLPNVVKH